jgi:hypothetical protein
MLLFRAACTCQEVVEDVEVPLAGWDAGYPGPFQPVIEYLSSNQGGIDSGRRVILEFIKQSGLGGRRGRGSLGRSQGIEDVGSEREFT